MNSSITSLISFLLASLLALPTYPGREAYGTKPRQVEIKRQLISIAAHKLGWKFNDHSFSLVTLFADNTF